MENVSDLLSESKWVQSRDSNNLQVRLQFLYHSLSNQCSLQNLCLSYITHNRHIKVHLTPNFFAKKNLLLTWNTSAKNFLIRINPWFSVPQWNLKNSSKTPQFLLHDRVWREWVLQLLWRLPRKIAYLPSSHFLEDNAIHIRKVHRHAFHRCSRLLQQYPR